MAVSKSILDMLADPPSPVESVRLEFFTKGKGRKARAYVRLIIVTPSGFVFTDEESVDKAVIEWRFEEGRHA